MENISIAQALSENYTSNAGMVRIDQVGEEAFYTWTTTIKNIYKRCKEIYESEEFSEKAQFVSKVIKNDDLFDSLYEALHLIGDVNGYSLYRCGSWRTEDLAWLLLAYSRMKPDGDTKRLELPTNNRWNIFRYRVERYIGRKVVEQQLKPTAMLEAEIEDLSVRRKFRQSQNKRAKLKNNKKSSENLAKKEEVREVTIGFKTFVVRSHARSCDKGHIVEPVRAKIEVMMPAGTVFSEYVQATYCKNCGMYFILDYDFRRLREEGVLLCQLISNDNYAQGNYASFGNAALKPESLLHQSGYNVSTADNLTAIQRQEILKRVMENGLYSKQDLLSFLDWLIRRSKNSSKKDMSSALSKWKADSIFVANY